PAPRMTPRRESPRLGLPGSSESFFELTEHSFHATGRGIVFFSDVAENTLDAMFQSNIPDFPRSGGGGRTLVRAGLKPRRVRREMRGARLDPKVFFSYHGCVI